MSLGAIEYVTTPCGYVKVSSAAPLPSTKTLVGPSELGPGVVSLSAGSEYALETQGYCSVGLTFAPLSPENSSSYSASSWWLPPSMLVQTSVIVERRPFSSPTM